MTVYSPKNLNDALDIKGTPDCTVVSGGTDYFPALKRRQRNGVVLSLTKVSELHGLRNEANGVRFGAGMTWSQIVKADLPPAFDALKLAGKEVGSIQIQNTATLAGNLCNASPAADGIPVLLALDAEIELQSAAHGARQIALKDFVKGVRKTDLQADEILTSIFVPDPPEGMRSVFLKLGSRTYLVISICMTALSIVLDSQGQVCDLRVAVGACSPVAQRLSAFEEDAIGRHWSDIELRKEHLVHLTPIDDVRASAAYRWAALKEQIQRALSAVAG